MKIALLEDDVSFALTITEWLKEAKFEVDHFRSGLDFLRDYPKSQYDLCILDILLPDMSGCDVLQSIQLKSSKLPPIVFLTGISDETKVIEVIDSGADDYIVKPVSKLLLMSRLNALLRRMKSNEHSDAVLEYGDLKLNQKKRLITLNDQIVKLTDKELDLAFYFFRNQGVLLSRRHLMHVVWGASSDIETRKVDVHVSHLRSKLKLTPEYQWKLSSIYQQGYRLEHLDGDS